ncbi:hypothetical protein M9H77_24127 [Catharanthus roseus]|uniref:Uncharacterized protein n=1 Tax=Catharanthus roseus TaxID=4058 RepID=A0ACC0AW70_CATRO|nr:hypothetical protein M9H77_24127 [Catharanthus roseus]
MQCHIWALRTKSGSRNEVIGIKFQHLVVKTHTSARLPNNRTPISLVKTGYRLLDHTYMEHGSYALSKKQKTVFVDSPGGGSGTIILQTGYQ